MATKEKVKLKMVMSDSGLKTPDGVNIKDNKYINYLEELANVEIDLTIPEYSDFATQVQLLLASKKLPDILHVTSRESIDTAASEGAFLELSDYYKNSINVKNVIDESQFAWSRAAVDGKNYAIPMSYKESPQGEAIVGRFEMVEKYNNGVWPENVDAWVEIMRKVKKDVPGSTPYANLVDSDYAIGYGGRAVYMLYGLSAWGGSEVWDYEN